MNSHSTDRAQAHELSATDLNGALIIEEYKACRELTLENIRIMDKTETFAVGAIGAVIVFTLGCSDPFLFRIIGFLAPVIAILGAMRFWGLSAVIRTTDGFLRACEPTFHTADEGWATYYEANKPGWLGRSRRAFWIVLVAVCLVFPGVCVLHGKPFNLHEAELPHIGDER